MIEPARLVATSGASRREPGTLVGYRHACAECGRPGAAAAGGFCCAPCRKGFNNRRMVRGAELYDLFMVARFDRPLATAMKLWGCLARLATGWRDEDRREREGRPSWRHPREIIARRPYIVARVLDRGRM